jgi:hypothetical protein
MSEEKTIANENSAELSDAELEAVAGGSGPVLTPAPTIEITAPTTHITLTPTTSKTSATDDWLTNT